MEINLFWGLGSKEMAKVKDGKKKYSVLWDDVEDVCNICRDETEFVTASEFDYGFVFVVSKGRFKDSAVLVYDTERRKIVYAYEDIGMIKAVVLHKNITVLAEVEMDDGSAEVYYYAGRTNHREWRKYKLAHKDENKKFDINNYEFSLKDGKVVCNVKYEKSAGEVNYYKFSDWKMRDTGSCEGELCPESMFIKYENFSGVPDFSHSRIMTYGNSVSFVAGYIKYIAVGDVIAATMLSDEELKEVIESEECVPVDEILRSHKGKNADIETKLQMVICVCDMACEQEDEELAKKLLIRAVELFNLDFASEEFTDKYNQEFELDIYFGAAEVKDILLDFIGDEDFAETVSEYLDRGYWEDEEINTIEEAMEYVW